MRAGHTQGPWAATPDQHHNQIIKTQYGKFIGLVPDRDEIDHGNAALIAAAPELLEALKEVADILDMLMHVRDVQPQEGSPAFKARAAIAKAEGGAA